jgi:hypothetical protein
MKSQIITLSSNASQSIFPHNSLSSFSARIPIRINQEGGITVKHVRLKSLQIHTVLETPDVHSGYIKVQLNQVRYQISDSTYERTLGTLKFPPEKTYADYGVIEFKNSPTLSLVDTPITVFSVEIKNSIGEQLKLARGPPTILELEIMTTNKREEFIIHCSSSHDNMYPNNTLSEFTSPIPAELNVENYNVALLNVVFPPAMSEKSVAKLYINDDYYMFTLNNYDTTNDFIRDVARRVREKYSTVVKFGRSEDGRVHFKRSGQEPETEVRIKFSKEFQISCGHLRNLKPSYHLQPRESLIFEGIADIASGLHSPLAMIYCDLIESNIVGDVYGPLLRIVPVKYTESLSTNSMYEPENLTFHTIGRSSISSIGFHLKDLAGRDRNFSTLNANDSLIITLLFRHK